MYQEYLLILIREDIHHNEILDVLYEFYGDFEFIKEKWNEKYEGILIKIKDEQGYKRCRLAKRTPKKEGYFTVFGKKTKIT